MQTKQKVSIDSYISSLFLDLYSVEPLVGVLLSRFKLKDDNSIDTMGVTHNTLLYNKEFVKGLSRSELLFVLYHELMHVALLHVDKKCKGTLNHTLYNIACDLYINKYIIDIHFGGNIRKCSDSIMSVLEARKIELNLLLDDKGNFKGMYESWVDINKDNIYTIYNKLNKDKNSCKNLEQLLKEHDSIMGTTYSTNGMSMESILDEVESELQRGRDVQTGLDSLLGSSDLLGTSSMSDVDSDELKRVLKDAMQSSKELSASLNKSVGKNSSVLTRLVRELLKPKVSWKKIITKEFLDFKRTDITYKKLDTRFNYLGLNLPDLDSVDIGCLSNISVAIDVSGSIAKDVYDQFMSDTINLFKQYKADGELLHWDTEITAKGKLLENRLQYINNLEVAGGGGTSTDCIFEYYDSLVRGKRPSLSIILTDGYISMSNKSSWARDYKKTIWIISEDGDKDFKPPFGRVLFM